MKLSEYVAGWMHWSTESERIETYRPVERRVLLHDNHVWDRSRHVGVRVAKKVR